MKVFVLTLLILNLMCFARGGEDPKLDFVDEDAAEGDVLPQEEDYGEDPEYTDDMEDDDDDSQEDEESDEPRDPDAFKDDEPEPIEDPVVKDKLKEGRSETPGKSDEADLKKMLDDKLGFN